MKRKIIKQSGRAYTITLPVKWIRARNVKEGDEIELDPADDGLLISVKGRKKEPRSIALRIRKGRESSARTLIVNAYRAGFDIIRVDYEGDRKELSDVAGRLLIGFELFENKDGSCSIESVSEPGPDNFESMIGRIFYLLREIADALSAGDIDEHVFRIQRYDNFLKRCISKDIISLEGAPALWQFLSNLSQVARLFYHFRKRLDHRGLSIDKKTMALYSRLNDMINILKKAYLKGDMSLLTELHDLDQRMNEDGESLMDKNNALVLHHVLMISRMIYLANSPLTGFLHARGFRTSG